MNRLVQMAVMAAGLVLGAAALAADRFPEKPITLICGFPPGAAADAQLRALGQALSKELGQTVVIDNRPGAAGTLAASALANSQPDGYTMAQVTNTLIRQPFLAKTSFDPIRDFTFLIGVSTFDFGLVVDAKSPWQNFQEFVAFAKQNPGKVSYGTIGIGSVPHQIMHKIGMKLGIDWTHIPYKGSSAAQTDLQGGNITALSDTTAWSPFVDAGKFRILAVYSEKRLKRYPGAPTLKELGIDLADDAPWGIAIPKGVPPERLKLLHDAFRNAMKDATFLRSLEIVANEPRYMSTDEYQKYMAARVPIEKDVVERYNLKQQ